MESEQQTTAIEAALAQAGELIVSYALSAAGAIAVLILGFIVAGVLSRWTRNGLVKFHTVDLTLAKFLSKVVKYAILVLVFVTVLAQFGVKTTSIIAALGAAGLAIGLALQGTLANVAAGIMLLVLRPFRVGEYIEAGSVSGTVQEIGLFTTELRKADGLFLMAPNSEIWSQSITNYSRYETRRLDITIGIDYDDDMEQARSTLMALAQADDRILPDPAPTTFVNSLDDSAVTIGLRAWTRTSDHLPVMWDMTEKVKSRFDEVGISIPYPRREIIQRPA